MLARNLTRYIHSGFTAYNVSNKALLSKLRKKTGYTFANCKKALELHNYDVALAEKWLQEQAQQLGWSKATKLGGRATAQGLIAVTVENDNGIIVEVNCETDFVARNKNFTSLVEMAAVSCLKHTASLPLHNELCRFHLDTDTLKNLQGNDGKLLSDHTALVIGKVGENITLRRAICFRAGEGIFMAGYAHPSAMSPLPILLGKYGALLAYTSALQHDEKLPGNISVKEIGRQLCQHVVGMNPSKIGVVNEDTPASNPDDESCMIYQEYLLDPSQTVGEVLASTTTTVLDYARLECGEEVPEVIEKVENDVLIESAG